MIDVWTLFACVISLVGVIFLTFIGKSHYREQKQFRYMINFLWFAEIFIWVSVMMLWG